MSEEKQQTIGEELSAARQARGLELEEIQRQSGVSLSVLQGIEADELDIIEPVFVRLALKNVCRIPRPRPRAIPEPL